MSKRFSIFLILIALNLSAVSQDRIVRCGTDERDEYYLENFDNYLQIKRSIASQMDQFLARNQKSQDEIIVPVVIHVVYRTDEQNITDEQIQSQIDVLNSDYNEMNWDTIKVPPVWKPLIANCKIQFRLANRDPDGNVTSGITRTQTSVQDICQFNGDLVYYTSKGGRDAWDTKRYLNIWVCETGGLLGFAAFPGAPEAEDGVVISYTSFGKGGTAEDPYDEGRTATHEVGHWFNLYHPWEVSCVNMGDSVMDTPEQEDEIYGCPFFPNISCSNGPDGDMFVNFMQYTDDNCMHMFTLDQNERMQATLNTYRSELKTSDGYNSVNHLTVNSSVLLYPIPATNELTIENIMDEGVVQITDFKGQILFSLSISQSDRETLDISSLSNGVYIVKFVGQKSYFSRKIVVFRP